MQMSSEGGHHDWPPGAPQKKGLHIPCWQDGHWDIFMAQRIVVHVVRPEVPSFSDTSVSWERETSHLFAVGQH